ncbi:PREDICTED: ankyrin repeat-containing protein At3g12360-like [Prunus mume]|uniref:Ankyrin repeat-containing protein At3g12360-like n=1 Tax=Prunus mume TaxID=102107 RepID=A0ABM1LJ22_PRUMU|nr:PREDICTED: ankyrin repeat-containing protein At3g12360-like [Prunus mume]
MCEVIKHLDGIDMEDLCGGAIFQAVELGVFEFIDRIFQASPDLVWSNNQNQRNPLQFAIECRQERIYSLIYRLDKTERNVIGNLGDTSNSNMLHMAAMLSPLAKLDNISGAALQMQRELQWFKEVETIVLPRMRDTLNAENLTPRALFTKNHKELVKEGERWMKETATSCTVVGALIITIMFASAFTVPGGNNGETGIPIFLKKKLFMVFIVSDAISLFSSTTSVLMFVSSGVVKKNFELLEFEANWSNSGLL